MLLRHLLSVALMAAFVWACSSPEGNSISEFKIQKADMSIEGMVCEMGCAKTIQDKLLETDGIVSAEVNYEKKSCKLEYDASKISDKEIIALIESVNGKDHYKVEKFKATKVENSSSGEVDSESQEDEESIMERMPNLNFPNIFSILKRV